MKTFSTYSIFILVIVFTSSCERPFAFSPFEVSLDASLKNTNAKNLERILAMDKTASPSFKIALISDPHFHFDELRKALQTINDRGDVDFIVVLGDVTENGLQKEYEIFHEIMSYAKQPYLAIIGNHDHLANGGQVYKQMYGDDNFTFNYKGVKFIAFDNVLWENPSPIDYPWLERQLAGMEESGLQQQETNHVIMLSHIPPFDRQLAEKREYFHTLLKNNGVKLSLHGHKHTFDIGEWGGEGVLYVTVGSPQHHVYSILSISENDFEVMKANF